MARLRTETVRLAVYLIGLALVWGAFTYLRGGTLWVGVVIGLGIGAFLYAVAFLSELMRQRRRRRRRANEEADREAHAKWLRRISPNS